MAMIPNTFTQRGVPVVDLRSGSALVCDTVVSPNMMLIVTGTAYRVSHININNQSAGFVSL